MCVSNVSGGESHPMAANCGFAGGRFEPGTFYLVRA